MKEQQRITTEDWELYDTRHTVFQPARMSADALERGYRRAYRDFYRWGSIFRGASTHDTSRARLRHAAYAAGWKKFEPLWDWVIRAKRVGAMLPMLELILSEFGERPSRSTPNDFRETNSQLPMQRHALGVGRASDVGSWDLSEFPVRSHVQPLAWLPHGAPGSVPSG